LKLVSQGITHVGGHVVITATLPLFRRFEVLSPAAPLAELKQKAPSP
jgi:hypothetical protein